MTKTVEFLVGIPGSGKSTYAKSQLHSNPYHANVARINKDDIRAANPKMKERDVLALQEQQFCGYANQGYERIIVDNTHLNPIHETAYRSLAGQFGYEFEVKWFDDSLDADLCHKRNIMPGRTPVPWQVIEEMHSQYVKLWMAREGQTVNNDILCLEEHVVVVDIDGTVAHNPGKRGWYDWKAVGGDEPQRDILQVVESLVDNYLPGQSRMIDRVVFLSGRDSVCFKETYDWIVKHCVDYFPDVPWDLYMRAEGDMRKDWIVKHELFMEHLNGKKYVKYWIDDRHQVVRHIRALGIRVLQVEAGLK